MHRGYFMIRFELAWTNRWTRAAGANRKRWDDGSRM